MSTKTTIFYGRFGHLYHDAGDIEWMLKRGRPYRLWPQWFWRWAYVWYLRYRYRRAH